MRRTIWVVALSLLAGAMPLAQSADHAAMQALSVDYATLKWQSIVPELGADSPQIAILRVDPKTQATQLLIKMPTKMHVPLHFHSANETHTVIRGEWVFAHEGKQHRLGPGGFNYLPA